MNKCVFCKIRLNMCVRMCAHAHVCGAGGATWKYCLSMLSLKVRRECFKHSHVPLGISD